MQNEFQTPPDMLKVSEVVERLEEKYRFATLGETGLLYVWTKDIWQAHAEAFIRAKIEILKVRSAPENFKREVLSHIKDNALINPADFHPPDGLIPLANGVFDIQTFKIREYRPEDYFTYKFPIEYHPDATDWKVIKKFLKTIQPDPDNFQKLIECFAVCMINRGDILQAAYMLLGSGSNGKDTFLALLIAMLGFENTSSIALQELESYRFARYGLFGKVANISAELPPRFLKDSNIFKKTTGGSPITADIKGAPVALNFVWRGVHLFACNELPETGDVTNAFFRRWIPIPFDRRFVELPDGSDLKQHKLDPSILAKITKPEQLSAFLNVVLKRIYYTFSKNRLRNRPTTEENREFWAGNDHFERFFKEKTTRIEGKNTPNEEVYDQYLLFCKENRVSPGLISMSLTAFSRKIKAKYPDLRSESRKIGGKSVREFLGIELKQPISCSKITTLSSHYCAEDKNKDNVEEMRKCSSVVIETEYSPLE